MKMEKKLLVASVLMERYKKYPGRTLMMVAGMGIILLDLVNNSIGFGQPSYDFTDRIILCVGLLACAIGFISPKIEAGDLYI